MQAYLYDGYWEDIGTIEAFYNANLGITKKPVPDFRYNRLCDIIIFSMSCNESMLVMNHDVYVFFFGVGDFDCSFYDRSSPIYTQPRYLPPSKMLDADITDSVIGEGCVIKVNFFLICSTNVVLITFLRKISNMMRSI